MKNMLIIIFTFISLSKIFGQTKADSVLYLGPYIVIAPKDAATQINGNYSLYVPKGILTEKVRIAIKNSSNWADFVFDNNYKLMPLTEVEKYIKQNKHLPDVPTALEVTQNGIDLAQTQKILLQKIEELTLHLIRIEKEMKILKQRKNSH